jgi:hypothetical protein
MRVLATAGLPDDIVVKIEQEHSIQTYRKDGPLKEVRSWGGPNANFIPGPSHPGHLRLSRQNNFPFDWKNISVHEKLK